MGVKLRSDRYIDKCVNDNQELLQHASKSGQCYGLIYENVSTSLLTQIRKKKRKKKNKINTFSLFLK